MGILIVEDDEVISSMCRHMVSGFARVWVAPSLQEATKILSQQNIELIILDISLPDGDGVQYYSQLHLKSSNVAPVIFLTGQKEVQSKVVAFSIGALDYIAKPFDSIEFQARVKAHWHRIHQKARYLDWNIYRLDQENMKVYLNSGNNYQNIDVTSVEFKILVAFLRSPGKVFSRDELIDRVWGNGHHITERNIDSHMARLRKKLTPLGGAIDSVRGCGYRLAEIKAKAS